MELSSQQPLFVFEMANNHMGSVEHGLRIIREFHEITRGFNFQFGFKLQYRHLDTFIHPDFQGRDDIKYVKRFSETKLAKKDFNLLRKEMDKFGFVSICTPFDEKSVDRIIEHGFDIVKIASCSFTDWPLLERIAKCDKPIIASTAGISLNEIDNVVSFFEHRKKDISLMHCVAEYPTKTENLQLNQIDLFRSRYPQIRIGYSTHEDPDNFEAIKIAVAKGATIFEKHVGITTPEFSLNAYSATPDQVRQWLQAAQQAFGMCGVVGRRADFSPGELASLKALRRGVFARRPIKKGERIQLGDTFLAIPTTEEQLTANDMSKYTWFYAERDIGRNDPILFPDIRSKHIRENIYNIVQQVKELLHKSKVVVPGKAELEISHHYGVDRFPEYGLTMITVINRDYCKKLLITLPGQKHPEQYHKQKEEAFHVLYGNIMMNLDGVEKELNPGDTVVIEKGTKHSFYSNTGSVIEEISSTHFVSDSYYTDPEILANKDRKTFLTYWMD